jgi:hypothetical protein
MFEEVITRRARHCERLGGIALRTAATATLVMVNSAAASCWGDPEVTQLAKSVAARHFPAVAESMPEVLVCDQLPNGWTAMHTSGGAPRISVAAWAIRDPYLTGILGHELAHHQVMLDGQEQDRSAGGHGVPFMRALLRAGLASEAQRVAQNVDGAGQALAQARASLNGAPSSPPALVAEANHLRRQQPSRACMQVWVPVSRFVDQNGCVHTTWQLQTQCAP